MDQIFPELHSILLRLLETSENGTTSGLPQSLEILCESYDLAAASYYTICPEIGHLKLVSQTGLNYSTYSSFYLTNAFTAGKCLETGVYQTQNISHDDEYRDRKLIEEAHLTFALFLRVDIAVCIERVVDKNAPVGILCLYSRSELSHLRLVSQQSAIRTLYSHIVTAWHTTDLSRLRQDVVSFSVGSSDLNSFLHKAVSMFKRKWNYEGLSVFLHDERTGLLRLHATTGVADNARKHDVFYRPDSGANIIKTFVANKRTVLFKPRSSDLDNPYPESVPMTIAVAWFPIRLPKSAIMHNQVPIGILRITNKLVLLNGTEERGPYSWDDLSHIRFFAEILGIITSFYRKAFVARFSLERTLHGVQNYVLASLRRNVHLLERSTVVNEKLEEHFRNYIPNTISDLESIQWQLDKFHRRQSKIHFARNSIALYGTVLAPVIDLAKKTHRSFSVLGLEITHLDRDEMKLIPFVLGDEEALVCIFRNLVENAIKYSKLNEVCVVDIEIKNDPAFVYVTIIDHGIGILPEDRDWIFAEGYRGENALRRELTGTGIGLSESREYAQEMGGDVYYEPRPNCTAFTVKMPRITKEHAT